MSDAEWTATLAEHGLNTIFPDVIKEMVSLPEGVHVSEHMRITAVGWCLRMFHGWEPNPVAAPTLFVHPTDPPLEHHRDQNRQAERPLPQNKEAVPGNPLHDDRPRAADRRGGHPMDLGA